MAVDFQKGVSFQIEGEMGRYNSLPIEALVKIVENLQQLIRNIALADITDASAIDLNAFKIELSAFRSGSAVPEFIFTPRVQQVITADIDKQREIVNQRFENLISISSSGQYDKIKAEYPNSQSRNGIVESLYDFSNSFGKSPVKIVNIASDNKIVPLYPVNKISIETKNKLITQIIDSDNNESIEEIIFARQKRITKGSKSRVHTLEQYSPNKSISLSYAPDVIEIDVKKYILNFPLRCNLEHEDDYYLITCEMLDIIGTGLTEEEAEKNFNQEFDFIYTRYNELKDENLSIRIINIKKILQIVVKSVE